MTRLVEPLPASFGPCRRRLPHAARQPRPPAQMAVSHVRTCRARSFERRVRRRLVPELPEDADGLPGGSQRLAQTPAQSAPFNAAPVIQPPRAPREPAAPQGCSKKRKKKRKYSVSLTEKPVPPLCSTIPILERVITHLRRGSHSNIQGQTPSTGHRACAKPSSA